MCSDSSKKYLFFVKGPQKPFPSPILGDHIFSQKISNNQKMLISDIITNFLKKSFFCKIKNEKNQMLEISI